MRASYLCGNMTAGPCWSRKSVVSSHPACSLMILTRLRSSVRTSNLFRGSRIAVFVVFVFLFFCFWNLCCNHMSCVSCVCVPTERNRKAKADHPGVMKPPPPTCGAFNGKPRLRPPPRGRPSRAKQHVGGRAGTGVAVEAGRIRPTTSNTIL